MCENAYVHLVCISLVVMMSLNSPLCATDTPRVVLVEDPECAEEGNANCEMVEEDDAYYSTLLMLPGKNCNSFLNSKTGKYQEAVECSLEQYCCGTCSSRFCCSEDEELDQHKCDDHNEEDRQNSASTLTSPSVYVLKWCDAYYDESDQYWPKKVCSGKKQFCSGTCGKRRCSETGNELDQSSCPTMKREPDMCMPYDDYLGTYHPAVYCKLNEYCTGFCTYRHCSRAPTKRLNQTDCNKQQFISYEFDLIESTAFKKDTSASKLHHSSPDKHQSKGEMFAFR